MELTASGRLMPDVLNARSGMLPARFGQLHPKYRTPVVILRRCEPNMDRPLRIGGKGVAPGKDSEHRLREPLKQRRQ